MKLYLASDHAGFELKAVLAAHLAELGHAVEDRGAYVLAEGDDYPDYVTPCAEAVAADTESFGIVMGASGQGEAMCANRVQGVRCAVYYGEPSHAQTDATGAALGMIASERAHNNANTLSLGARFISEDDAKRAVEVFLATPFSGDERHVRRLSKF
jgi:ribose 5-phosphate isomerase B